MVIRLLIVFHLAEHCFSVPRCLCKFCLPCNIELFINYNYITLVHFQVKEVDVTL
jgi:hypothetical protein